MFLSLSGGADAESNIILLPPASSSQVSQFTAPLIIPGLSTEDTGPETGTATRPVNVAQVDTATTAQQLSIPDFDNDEQLYHFVTTRLQRVLSDCDRLLQVGASSDCSRLVQLGDSSDWQIACFLFTATCCSGHQQEVEHSAQYVAEWEDFLPGEVNHG